MILIRLSAGCLAYGMQALLDNTEFQIESGERVALIGRNGEGKSTLLKLIGGLNQLDSGELWRAPELRVTMLEQDLNWAADASVYDVVVLGFGEIGRWLAEYHHLSVHMDADDAAQMNRLADLQHKIDAKDGWNVQARVSNYLEGMGLDPEQLIADLSGGMQRRVSMAGALVAEPDLLLLDEPTNHLDIAAIDWLEQQLINFSGGVLFVTHDRTFLGNLATRIVDLDRGRLSSWPGNYAAYLRHKNELLESEARSAAEFDKKLAAEEVWIRQGIKARRTRNEGRVRALKKMRDQQSQRRTQQGKAKISMQSAEQSGKLVIEAKHISFSYGDIPIFKDFSTVIMRGDKVGLVGPNGVGKTTLLRNLLGQEKPDSGSVRTGTNLEVAYFDQLRSQLKPTDTIIDSVSEGVDMLAIGKRQVHIMSYLQEFLFSPDRARQPISSLSGGEKNRAMLAKLFTKPANLLVMDEPTNDLDVETLELLEELLVNYEGTLLLVSHDRTFLDNVVTSTLVFEGDGQVNEYIGGYSDWLRHSKTRAIEKQAQASTEQAKTSSKAPAQKGKLSYKDQRELDALPALIAKLEEQQTSISQQLSAEDFYTKSQQHINQVLEQAKQTEQQLEQAYTRWDELESLRESFS